MQRGEPQPNFHHEGHEEHEVLKKPIWRLFFVLFVSFVVKESFQK